MFEYFRHVLGHSSNATVLFGIAMIWLMPTYFLFMLRIRLHKLRPCLVGLGFAPLIIFSASYLLLTKHAYDSVFVYMLLMLVIFAPSFPLTFGVAAGILISEFFGRGRPMLSERTLCLWLLLVHLAGFTWSCMVTAKG